VCIVVFWVVTPRALVRVIPVFRSTPRVSPARHRRQLTFSHVHHLHGSLKHFINYVKLQDNNLTSWYWKCHCAATKIQNHSYLPLNSSSKNENTPQYIFSEIYHRDRVLLETNCTWNNVTAYLTWHFLNTYFSSQIKSPKVPRYPPGFFLKYIGCTEIAVYNIGCKSVWGLIDKSHSEADLPQVPLSAYFVPHFSISWEFQLWEREINVFMQGRSVHVASFRAE
jgi:hypothetical protein